MPLRRRSTAGLVALWVAFAYLASAQVTSHEVPAEFELVRRFHAAVTAGDAAAALAHVAPHAVFTSFDLDWRVWNDDAAVAAHLGELIADGARIEAELVAVLAEGSLVVTHDRTWSAALAPDLAPYRRTVVYLIEEGRIVASTAVLVAAQRDALAARRLVGTWRWIDAPFYFLFDADGGYRASSALDDLRSAHPQDEGRFRVELGTLSIVSGDGARYCYVGQAGSYVLRFVDDDVLELLLRDDACWTRRAPTSDPQTFRRIPTP